MPASGCVPAYCYVGGASLLPLGALGLGLVTNIVELVELRHRPTLRLQLQDAESQ